MRITRFETYQEITAVKEKCTNYCGELLTSPSLIADFLKSPLVKADKLDHEKIWLLCFNTKNRLIGYFEASSGTIDASIITPRELFVKALTIGARTIVIAHNHPSGDCNPSIDDNVLTQRIKDAGELVGIPLLDHIIIADNYYSYCEAGTLEGGLL